MSAGVLLSWKAFTLLSIVGSLLNLKFVVSQDVADCATPPTVENGYMLPDVADRAFRSSDVVKYGCDEDYHKSNNATYRCNSNGSWIIPTPTAQCHRASDVVGVSTESLTHNSLNVTWYYHNEYNISRCTLRANDLERTVTNPDVHNIHHINYVRKYNQTKILSFAVIREMKQDTKFDVSVTCCIEFRGNCPNGKTAHRDLYTRVAPVSDLVQQRITDDSADISWTLPPDIGPNHTISAHVETPLDIDEELTIWTNKSGLSITKLESERRYTVTVIIRSALRNGSESEAVRRYINLSFPVLALKDLRQMRNGTTPRSVGLGWSYQEGNNRESKCEIAIADQHVEYDSRGAEGRQGVNNSKVVIDLAPDTQYRVRIRCCSIPGDFSSEMNGLLDECLSKLAYNETDQVFTLPGTVSNIRVVSRGSNSAQLAWSLPEGATQTTPLELTFTPKKTASGTTRRQLWANKTGMNLYDLDGDLTYEMSIRVGTRHPYTRYGSVSPSNIHGALRNLQFMIRKYQGDLTLTTRSGGGGGLPLYAWILLVVAIALGFVSTALYCIYRLNKLKMRVGLSTNN